MMRSLLTYKKYSSIGIISILLLSLAILSMFTPAYAAEKPPKSNPFLQPYTSPFGIDTNSQRDVMFKLEIPYYNVDDCLDNTTRGNSNGKISGKDNMNKIYSFLMTATFHGHRLNKAQAIGIVNNINAESSFDPSSVNSIGASGIAQWMGGRWDPKLLGDLEGQLHHLKDEMDGEEGDSLEKKGFFNVANSKEDSREATVIFCNSFERPGRSVCDGRRNNKPNFYDEVDDVDQTAGSIDTQASSKPERYIWVGDSRTGDMRNAVGGTDRYVYKDGAGYSWLDSTGIKDVNSDLKKTDAIIFNLGVNDLDNIDRYIDRLNKLAKNEWQNNKIYVVSVNPTDKKRADLNSQIQEFNSKMKSGLNSPNLAFIDTYSDLTSSGFQTADGVHYQNATSKKIYDLAKRKIGELAGTLDNKLSNHCVLGGSGGGATKYAKDGAKIYLQFDKRWASTPFGPSTVGRAGCGPSAMAMVITALTGQSVTPDMTAKEGAARGGATGAGSSWNLPELLAESGKFGIRAEKIQHSISAMNKVLTDGGMLWMCGHGGEPYNSGGHCIAVRARTESGNWKVFDSSGRTDADKEISPDAVFNGANNGSVTAVYKQ